MTNRPDDFGAYWDEVDRRLASTPADPELTHSPLRSNEHCDVYELRITSSGPYRIFGYFSVPKGDGPFPAVCFTPGYGSVAPVPNYNDRMRYVCLQVIHRGQRLADDPWAAAYPGLLTERISEPEDYIYRDIVADCLRGAEFLLGHPDVDPERVAIVGDDLALITAARRPGFTTIVASGIMFHQMLDACARTEAYPHEEINEYLRAHPGDRDDVAQTLSYFDPVHHVDAITATTLVSAGPAALEGLQPLIETFGNPAGVYMQSGEGRTDQDAIDFWLAGEMDVLPMSKFIRELA